MADLQEIREAVVIRPGDTLIIRCELGTTPEDAIALKDAARSRIPDVNVLIVVAEQLLVYRPGEVLSCA